MGKVRKMVGAFLERRGLVSIGYTFINEMKRLVRFGYFYPPPHFDIAEKKIAYIIIPKAACSSIKASMTHRDFPNNYSLHTALPGKKGLVDIERDCFTFSFTRNPFDRLVSCYKNKYDNELREPNRHFFIYRNYFLGLLANDRGFDRFIKRVCAIPKRLADGHFLSQYLTLYRHGKCVADYVGKFENLENDYEPIREKYNFARLKQYNASDKGNWMDYYTPKTAKMVYRKFRKDFETFGYQAEYEKLLAHLNAKTANKSSE